jgi:hypothetical protein
MPNTQIVLEVSSTGTAIIKQVSGDLQQLDQKALGAAKGAGQAESSFSLLRQTWFQVTAAAGGLAFGINAVMDAAERAALVEQTTQRLNLQLSDYGRTAASLVPEIKALTSGQLSLADATKLASQGLAAGLNIDQLKTFTQLATVAADVMGTSIPMALDQLLSSIASGRTSLLKQIGIVVDLGEAKLKLARDTGVAVEAITNLQEQQLLLNEVMKQAPEAIKKVSDGTDSLATRIQREESTWTDFFSPSGHGPMAMAAEAALNFVDGVRAEMRAMQEFDESLDIVAASERAFADVQKKTADEALDQMRQSAAAQYKETLALDLLRAKQQDAAIAIGKTAEAEYKERLATDLGTAAINAKTAALVKLTQAQNVLAQLENERAMADLTRGGADDTFRRAKQMAFEGASGTSIEGLQFLIGAVKGQTGGDEEEKARTLNILTEQLRLLATSQVNDAQRVTGTPQQQAALERSGGESAGPVGFAATVIQPSVTVNVGGKEVAAIVESEQRASELARMGAD